MAQRILNNQDYANDFRTKINDNFTELFNNNVPTNHADTTDMYGAATSQLYGHVKIQAANGLNINNGVISISGASTTTPGAVKLASTAASTSPTDAVTSKVLSDALRGQAKLPMIFYGTDNPTSTNPANAVDGDLYVKYE